MTWPIPPLATTRTNDTPQFDTHPADHNAIASALNTLGPYVPALPRGLIGTQLATAPQTKIGGSGTTAYFTGCQLTFQTVAGRKYLLLAYAAGLLQEDAAGQQRMIIADGAGGLITQDIVGNAGGGVYVQHNISWVITGGGAIFTVKLGVAVYGGTCSTIGGFLPLITVIDIGAALPS